MSPLIRFSSSKSVMLAGAGKARVVALSARVSSIVYVGYCIVDVWMRGYVDTWIRGYVDTW